MSDYTPLRLPEDEPDYLLAPEPTIDPAQKGGCLKVASIVLGILSLAASALLVPTFFSGINAPPGELGGFTAAFAAIFWLISAAPLAILSFICALVYSLRAPNKRASSGAPMLIGSLALGVALLSLLIGLANMGPR